MKISALNKTGKVKEYDVVLTYLSEKNHKQYIVYTENEYDKNHELILYISEYNHNNPEQLVSDIVDIKEYNEVKKEIDKILVGLRKETEKL